jgi:hypothetical protein
MPDNQWVDKMAKSSAVIPSGTQQAAITDLTVTGTYATDDTPIETAVNSILDVLRAYGMIAE